MSTVMRLCETESQALKANLGHLLSPEVSSSLMWFLRRFCLSYLLPNESFYTEVWWYFSVLCCILYLLFSSISSSLQSFILKWMAGFGKTVYSRFWNGCSKFKNKQHEEIIIILLWLIWFYNFCYWSRESLEKHKLNYISLYHFVH